MAEFPLDPNLSKMLIMSVNLNCSDEILTVVSMLSIQNVFYRPKEKQAVADQKKAKFNQPEVDRLTRFTKFSSPDFIQILPNLVTNTLNLVSLNLKGDHLTLLAVYNSWKNNKFSSAWCFENFVQMRTLKRAQVECDQIW